MIIERIERDEMFKPFMAGKKQVIMVGEIGRFYSKSKLIVTLKNEAIVDLKTMKNFEKMWVNGLGKGTVC